jgi:hypothetical protein
MASNAPVKDVRHSHLSDMDHKNAGQTAYVSHKAAHFQVQLLGVGQVIDVAQRLVLYG